MAIVDLGTLNLVIGDTPVDFNTFDYNRRRAYLLYGQFTASNFSNIASTANLYCMWDNGDRGFTRHPETYNFPITAEPFSFWLPFSRLFESDGDAFIRAERLSNVYGGADQETLVSLNLSYDDDEDIRSWRD